MRPGAEGGAPGRRREAGPVGADALDVAREPGGMDGKGSPEMGVDGHATMCDGHGLPAEAGVSIHLRAGGCRGRRKAVPKLLRLGLRYAGLNRKTLRADGPSCQDGGRSLGGNPRSLDSRSDDRLHRGLNRLLAVVPRKARGYLTVEYMTSMLYIIAGKLTLP